MDLIYYGIPLKQWLIAFGAAALVLVVLKVTIGLAARRIKKLAGKTKTSIDDMVAAMLARTRFFFIVVVSLGVGSHLLSLPELASKVVGKIMVLALLVQGALWGSGLASFWTEHYKKKKIEEEDKSSVATFTALAFVLKLALWVVAVLLALDNLGVEVTALITGLGIGGVAVALAVQNILGDLFASLSIVLDKPFVIGDFIIVDDQMGTVEKIGLKTTRLRSLSGEQLIFSNSDLLNSRIRNFKRMQERRVVFTLGVVYQTPVEKLAAIPNIIRSIIEATEQVRFERSHFRSYGDSSLDFETVYWVLSPDYNLYMDRQHEINLEIYRRFEKEGIEFAYPTRTLYLEKPA